MWRTCMLRCLPTDKKAFMELVKTLRYRTEAPISDCTSALRESAGDMDAAVALLRKKGAARAMKKGNRITEHGFVVCCRGSTPASGAAIITMCSETDFAARNSHFQRTCVGVQAKLRAMLDASGGSLLADPAEATRALTEECAADLQAAIAVLGENMRIGNVTPLKVAPHMCDHLSIGAYTHGSLDTEDVGRIVGLVALSRHTAEAEVEREVLTSAARHFVATSGAEGSYTHQEFFGSSEETVGKWLKRHNLRFSSSLVLEFGKEPVEHMAPVIPNRSK